MPDKDCYLFPVCGATPPADWFAPVLRRNRVPIDEDVYALKQGEPDSCQTLKGDRIDALVDMATKVQDTMFSMLVNKVPVSIATSSTGANPHVSLLWSITLINLVEQESPGLFSSLFHKLAEAYGAAYVVYCRSEDPDWIPNLFTCESGKRVFSKDVDVSILEAVLVLKSIGEPPGGLSLQKSGVEGEYYRYEVT